MKQLLLIGAVLIFLITGATDANGAESSTDSKYHRLTTAADLFNSTDRPTDEWSGFDPARYKDMSFYNENGNAHLRGRIIDYTPDSDIKTVGIRIYDCIVDSHNFPFDFCDINSDGTFSMDLRMAYPQYDYLVVGKLKKTLFLIPGDTLSIVTTMEDVKRDDRGKLQYFGYEGEINDAAAVNILSDSIIGHFALERLWSLARNADKTKGIDYTVNEEMAAILDTVIAGLPALLENLPVSSYAKDLLSMTAIGFVAEIIEDLWWSAYRRSYESGISDIAKFFAPHSKHLYMLYDNPLLLCKGFILPNRWENNNMFGYTTFTDIFSKGNVSAINIARLDNLGVGNCFAAQLSRALITKNRIKHIKSLPPAQHEKLISDLITVLLKKSEYRVIDQELMSSYNRYVKQIALIESQLDREETVDIDSSACGGVLQRITAPYSGNVLFLDIWSIGCGSCRMEMMAQKPLLDEYAGKPFKVLYIAPVDEATVCKKWLEKENIKGEHLFVSEDDLNRLMTLFQFGATPFGVIIDRDGKVIRTGYNLTPDKELLDKLL